MKIIFVDVDGVLNHRDTEGWQDATKSFWVLDPGCVNRLKEIVEQTGAKLVLSSTWRLSPMGTDALAQAGLDFIGRTPQLHFNGDERSQEILTWMQFTWPLTFGWNGEKVTHLAVLDDDIDADLTDGSFFRTWFEHGGLTFEIAQQVIAHLNKPSSLVSAN